MIISLERLNPNVEVGFAKCRSSVMNNWKEEIAKFDADLEARMKNIRGHEIPVNDIDAVTIGQMKRAQGFKNPKAKPSINQFYDHDQAMRLWQKTHKARWTCYMWYRNLMKKTGLKKRFKRGEFAEMYEKGLVSCPTKEEK